MSYDPLRLIPCCIDLFFVLVTNDVQHDNNESYSYVMFLLLWSTGRQRFAAKGGLTLFVDTYVDMKMI